MIVLSPTPSCLQLRILVLWPFLFACFVLNAPVVYGLPVITNISPRDYSKNSAVLPVIVCKPVKTFAGCDDINWATWNNFTGKSATGTITEGATTYNVTMTANYDFGSTPDIYNIAKFNNYPSPVPNRTVPKTSWTIGNGGVTEMCFSQKVTNPVLLIASLGNSSGFTARLDFSVPYVVLYDGGNMVYNSNTALSGTEGYAIIMFPGDFNCVSIKSNTEEVYTNITWGLKPPPFPVDIDVVSNNCSTAVLRASGGVSYKWDGGDTPNSATNTFHASGQYVVTVTDANGCSNSATKAIAINSGTAAPPVISGSPAGCVSATLTASGGATYLWDGGLTPNSATNTFNVSGNYTVVMTDANGCVTSASQLVSIGAPVAGIVTTSATCSSTTLTASGGQTYLWNGGNSPNSAVNTFTTSGRYTVTVDNGTGCTSSASMDVIITPAVVPAVSIEWSPAGAICSGTIVNFRATGNNDGTNGLYEWLLNGTRVGTGKSYNTDALKDNDEITCRLSSTVPCAVPTTVTSNKFVAQVNPAPQISFNQNLAITDDTPVQLNPITSGDLISYRWEPATGLSDSNIKNPVANPAVTTAYRITVVSASGCETYADVTVTVAKGIIVPNAFTPNGDGINDIWMVKYLTDYPNARIDIFNRYGQPVYHSTGYKKPWDGTHNGKPLPSGVYYYIIDLRVKTTPSQAGYITLLR